MWTVESERFAHRSYTGEAREPERGEIREGRSSRDLVGHELADGGRELETVTRAGAHQVHAVVLRMPVNDEVLIWGVRVKANGGRRRRAESRDERRGELEKPL